MSDTKTYRAGPTSATWREWRGILWDATWPVLPMVVALIVNVTLAITHGWWTE